MAAGAKPGSTGSATGFVPRTRHAAFDGLVDDLESVRGALRAAAR